MIKIGVTGGIGSGKSFVCALLRQRGVPVYSCDDEARRIMRDDPCVRGALMRLIGADAYRDGELNKVAVARYLFSDPAHAARVNAIVHPAVRADFERWAEGRTALVVAQECALLFETGFDSGVDFTVEVYAPRALRLERAMRRDNATAAQIEARMAMQMDEDEKCRRADFRIDNDGSELNPQIDALLQRAGTHAIRSVL